MTEKQGLVLAMLTPVSGNHNYLFNIENTSEELTTMILMFQLIDYPAAGFDSESLHQLYHQKQIIANIAPNKRNTTDDNWVRTMDE